MPPPDVPPNPPSVDTSRVGSFGYVLRHARPTGLVSLMCYAALLGLIIRGALEDNSLAVIGWTVALGFYTCAEAFHSMLFEVLGEHDKARAS